MSHEQIINLAKKLKALADRGIGGEQTNALDMLERFMRKHSLTFDDLSEENREQRRFRFKNRFHKQILIQSIVMVMGSGVVMKGFRGYLYGIPVYETSRLGTSSGSRVGALAHKSALAFATANIAGGNMPGTVRLQSEYLTEYLGTLVVADIIYGVIENRDTSGVLIKASS